MAKGTITLHSTMEKRHGWRKPAPAWGKPWRKPKKKVKKFGSPPEVHEREAGQDARRAVKLARKASEYATKGKCGTALGVLTTAHYYAGEANMSAISAGHGRAEIKGRHRRALRIGRLADTAVNRATARFRLVCNVHDRTKK
jgi:hypothetical protein